MLTTAQKAIIKKEKKRVTGIKGSLPLMVIEQLKLTIYMPILLLLIPWLYSIMPPDDLHAIENFLTNVGIDITGASFEDMISKMVNFMMNSVMPHVFMIAPLKVGVDIAAGSMVTERFNKTLETLCYTPNSLKDIIIAKTLATTSLSLKVTYICFALTFLAMQLGTIIVTGAFLSLTINWVIMLFVILPALAILSGLITLKVATKAKSELEVKQKSVLYIALFVAFPVAQITGLAVIGPLLNFLMGIALYILIIYLFKTINKMTYEDLLQVPKDKVGFSITGKMLRLVIMFVIIIASYFIN